MKPRPALMVAVGITAFLLVIVGSVIATLSSGTAEPDGGKNADLLATFEQRELEYQRQLDSARTQIEETNRRLADAYRDLTTVSGGGEPPVSGSLPVLDETFPPVQDDTPVVVDQPTDIAEPAMISTDQAIGAAVAYRGGGTVERVELEEEHGLLVFDVRFVDDSRVYVDAFSGEVVYARLEPADDNPSGGDDDDDNSGSGSGGDDDNSGSGSGSGGDDDDRSGKGGGDDDDDDDRSGKGGGDDN